jgi:hypothetical protein
MRRIVSLAAAWTAATLVAIVVAAAAVGSVRSEVADAPAALGDLSIDVAAIAEAPDPDVQPISTTTLPAETTTTENDASAIETTTTTSVVEADSPMDSTTTTMSPPPVATTSTATSTTETSYTKTYDTKAGSVRIVVSGESVTFAGATPLPGWKAELENSGPEEVNVHFESNEDDEEEIEFKAKIDDGELKVSTSESEDD